MMSKSVTLAFIFLLIRGASSFTISPSHTHVNQRHTNLMAWTPNSSEQQSLSDELSIAPLDEYNAALLNEVRPLDYTNPKVEWGTVWDLVVVGAGAGGLVSSRQVSIGFGSYLCKKYTEIMH